MYNVFINKVYIKIVLGFHVRMYVSGQTRNNTMKSILYVAALPTMFPSIPGTVFILVVERYHRIQ